EHYDHYQHDSGWSVSWAWHEAPRANVHADVLSRLLAPGPYPKRVSLVYRPFSAGDAARVTEREVNAAAFRDALRAAQKRDENARDRADKERAMRAAREEAAGAGVGPRRRVPPRVDRPGARAVGRPGRPVLGVADSRRWTGQPPRARHGVPRHHRSAVRPVPVRRRLRLADARCPHRPTHALGRSP